MEHTRTGLASHTHASPEALRIAGLGTVLLCQSGSAVHGTSVGPGDRDEMGICLEPASYITGLARVPDGHADPERGAKVAFEQFEYHTAWERTGRLLNRSGEGDLDLCVYSARKWARLALAGNPSVLLPLFVPDHEIVRITDAGRELRANTDRFASKIAARKFLGYMAQQRLAITGEAKGRNNRWELVEQHGYDTKSAAHALRLGIQGTEYLGTGRISLPMPEPDRDRIRQVRQGNVPLASTLDWFDHLDAGLRAAADSSPLPDEPDHAWVDRWLDSAYLAFWQGGSDLSAGYAPLLPGRTA